MLFAYKVTTEKGEIQSGTIEAPNRDIAINSLQRRNLIIIELKEAEKKPFWARHFSFSRRVASRDVVLLSRQIATLFEASVAVLNSFKLLASETANPVLRQILAEITDDIQAGLPISAALSKHPQAFSPFYVNMVKSGEESGKLPETLGFLADYLERTYELAQKARNALIYPIFIVVVFIAVMILMLVIVIPQLSAVLLAAGQDLPLYTKLIVGTSEFFVSYGIYLLVLLIAGFFFLWRYYKTESGRLVIDSLKLSIPYIGTLYRKLYLSRISDNLDTMLSSGISMIRAIEITSEVVGNQVYKNLLLESAQAIQGGNSMSEAFGRYPEVPGIMVQMIKIGEETGKTGFVLKTIARFYKREVDGAVDNIVNLIEPFMILVLGLGVGVMLAAILIPIYNIASAI